MADDRQALRELVAQILRDTGVVTSIDIGSNPPHTNKTALATYLEAFQQVWDHLAGLSLADS